MPKTKVKITTKSNNITDTYEIKALLKDNKLMYYEPNKTKVIFDYENNILTRNNKEISMEYKFDLENKTIGYIEVKELGKSLNLNIKTKKFLSDNKSIDLVFFVEEEEICYKLEVLEWVLLKT